MSRTWRCVPGALPWLWIVMVGNSFSSLKAEDDGRKAIRQAILAGDVQKLDDSVKALARSGGAAGLKLVLEHLEKIPASEDSLYWSLLVGAVSFRDRPAMEELGKYVIAKKGNFVARDLLHGLAKNTSPFFVLSFKPLLFEGPDELRLMVAKKVSMIRSHDSVDVLIELLQREEKAKGEKLGELGWIAVEGLARATGQNFGPSAINWEGWWKKNRDKPLADVVEKEGGARTGTAVDFLKVSPDRARREAFLGVEKAPEKAVVVLSAKYTKKSTKDLNNDHIEKVLASMNIPHTVVLREDFQAFDLKDTGILLINCAQFHEHCICPTCKPGGGVNNRLYRCTGCEKHIKFKAELTSEDIKKIVNYVNGGGFLFCEDWTVKEVVERAFPKFVSAGDKLKKSSVDVLPGRGQGSHPYLRGIFEPKVVHVPPELSDSKKMQGEDAPRGRTVVVNNPSTEEPTSVEEDPPQVKHQWNIDNESFALKILDRSRVVAFLTSGKLQADAGGDGAVALCFRPGSVNIPPGTRPVPKGSPGVVTVVLSHFGHQQSTEDEMSIQNLLLNVLLDANAARDFRSVRKLEPGKKAEKNSAGGS